MKKLNDLFRKISLWGTSGLLSLLGFHSCDRFLPPMEYGTPHAKYTVSGKVTDSYGNELSQIQVVVPTIVHHTPPRPGFIPDHPITTIDIRDTLYTQSDGSYEYTYDGFPTDTVRIFLKFEDFSSTPVYEPDSTRVDFKFSDLKGGKSWDKGSAKKEVNMKLKAKTP